MISWLEKKLDKFLVKVKQESISWAKKVKEEKSYGRTTPPIEFRGLQSSIGYCAKGTDARVICTSTSPSPYYGVSGISVSVSTPTATQYLATQEKVFQCSICEKMFYILEEQNVWQNRKVCNKCFNHVQNFIKEIREEVKNV